MYIIYCRPPLDLLSENKCRLDIPISFLLFKNFKSKRGDNAKELGGIWLVIELDLNWMLIILLKRVWPRSDENSSSQSSETKQCGHTVGQYGNKMKLCDHIHQNTSLSDWLVAVAALTACSSKWSSYIMLLTVLPYLWRCLLPSLAQIPTMFSGPNPSLPLVRRRKMSHRSLYQLSHGQNLVVLDRRL